MLTIIRGALPRRRLIEGQAVVLKAACSQNQNQNTNNSNLANEITQSFLDWVTNKLVNTDKWNIQDAKTKFGIGEIKYKSFFEQALNDNVLQQYIDYSNSSLIDWQNFPFDWFYKYCIAYLKTIENNRDDYSQDPIMFCEHHIKPKFEKGDNSAENRVLLHIYEHSFVHLLRWFKSQSGRDLGAVKSNLRTKENVNAQHTKRAANPPNSPTPPKPAINRKKPAVTAKVIQHSSNLGKKNQVNSRTRVNAFTWFICTMDILFYHTTNIEYEHKALEDIFSIGNTASEIGRVLGSITTNSALHKNPQNLADVIKGIKPTRGGWGIKYAKIPLNALHQYSIQELNLLFSKTSNIFEQCFNNANFDLSTLTANELALLVQEKHVFDIKEKAVIVTIAGFLIKRQKFMQSFKN